MNIVLDQIKKAEALGIVGDSQEVRLELVKKMTQGLLGLDEMKKELKKIKAQARKEGLLIRSDFTKNKLWDFDMVQVRIIYLRHQKLENKIPIKENEKKTIHKI